MKKSLIALTFLIGIIVGSLLSAYLFVSTNHSPAESLAFDFQNKVNYLMLPAGEVKSDEKVASDARLALAMTTGNIAQIFDEISDDAIRQEVVRMVQLLEASPSLETDNTDFAALASAARKCVVAHASKPSQVTLCAREALHSTNSDGEQIDAIASAAGRGTE